MNKKQKISIFSGLIAILIAFAIWAIQGFHLFTHQKVEVQLPQSDVDKLLGQPPRYEWVNHFTLGLEYTLAFAAIAIGFSVVLFFLFKSKRIINQ
ncbi:MAG TPA: hypothetical protein VMV32_06275 [Ignavibacteriaceae bacterium]|nr:hypothetical protein [Ignavibacteriaceae bacterium]